jgi:hypothetical protein
MAAPRDERDPFLRLIEERYLDLERVAQDKEAAGEAAHQVVLYYHTPGGESIEVVGNVYLDEPSGGLIVEGLTASPVSEELYYCEAIVRPQNAVFTMEVLPLRHHETPRPKPGFIRE